MTLGLLVVALIGTAEASDRVSWRMWSWTGAEASPSYGAETELRAEQQVGLAVQTLGGLRLDALGGVRELAEGTGFTGDLYRLSVSWRGPTSSARFGRIVVGGERGFLHLDGIVADTGWANGLSVRGWAGQSWHPESWSAATTTILGGELRGGGDGAASGGIGWEARRADGELVHRVHAFGRLRHPRGSWASLLAEAAPLEDPLGDGIPPARLALAGAMPFGADLDLGADLRWEGLNPAVMPEALSAPMDWLAGPGYATANVRARARLGAVTLRAEGGPTLHGGTKGTTGGSGRLSADYRIRDGVSVGLAAVGAASAPSWVSGGVAEARIAPAETSVLRGEFGWFAFQPLTGPVTQVVEGRLTGDVELSPAVTLAGEVAGGSDRILQPWVRGGLALRVVQGKGAMP